ncbi:MAG TPA: metallophosphoesterase [Solirubrobacteraceae bacterium]|nr:metallophosphoesterase [Solirubrobacteraceae bacterium]
MSRPFLLAQLTDPHIGAHWDGPVSPAAALARAVDALRTSPDPPDAVVVTGDLANRGKRKQYAAVREQLERLGVPSVVLAGNHDDRAKMREAFELPGDRDDPIHSVTDLGPLRLVALDTMIPGKAGGALRETELQWLERSLDDEPERPTVVALHHPPVVTGVPPWDATVIGPVERRALDRVVSRHPQVLALIAGHLHRTLISSFAGRPSLVVPSTYMQAELDWSCEDFVLVPEPPAFGLHTLLDGQLVSHVQPIG